jgi:glycosyltransferase involved in cell wall biosynthesis
MKPRISIISVTFNAGQFLEKTILSILNQDCSDFEYIIIDGNSTDNTLDIIQNHESKISQGEYTLGPEHFHWMSEADKGLYDAMNKGLKMAKGEYVWFINAGDKIHSNNTLHGIIECLNQNPSCDVLYGKSLMIDQEDKILGNMRKTAPKGLTKKSLLKGLVVCHQAILVKKEITPFYNLQYRIASDYDWVINILGISQQNIYIDNYLSNYMVSGISSKNETKAWKERFLIMKKHFGLCSTLWAHFIIILKYPFTRKY